MTPVAGALPGGGFALSHNSGEPPAPPEGDSGNTPPPYFIDQYGNAAPYRPSAELSRIISALPICCKTKFTPELLSALDVAMARTRQRPNSHKIDYRVSVPVFGRRYYIVLLAGKERRTIARISSEGHNKTWRITLAYAILMSALACAGLVGIIVLLYFVKTMVGVDLFEQNSILHGLFY